MAITDENSICAWATADHGVHVEPTEVVASRIARAEAFQGWVWTPQTESWSAWWQLPNLVAAVAARMPPPWKAEARPQPSQPLREAPGSGQGRSKSAPRTPTRESRPGTPPRSIREAPPDLETFLRLAAQRQGARAEARYDEASRRARGDWREVSLLRAFGYTVSKADDLSERQRREILEDFLYCELPRQWEGRAEWRPPDTSARLDKMVGFLLDHNVRLKEDMPTMEDAVRKWRADAEWLESTFGSRGVPAESVEPVVLDELDLDAGWDIDLPF